MILDILQLLDIQLLIIYQQKYSSSFYSILDLEMVEFLCVIRKFIFNLKTVRSFKIDNFSTIIIIIMSCFSYIYRKVRIFWRYRHQNNNYQTLKYYLVIGITNLTMLAFYILYSHLMISQQLFKQLVAVIILNIMTVASMITTHATNPGQLPAIKKEAEFSNIQSNFPPFNGKIYFGENHQYTMVCQNKRLQIKFCSTCNIYRPNLASHCSQCKKCVQEMDHHCPWLANCIGKKNYSKYYFHLTSTMLLIISVSGLCAYEWVYHREREFIFSAVTVILILLSISVGIPLITLWVMHTYFALKGISTRVFLKRLNVKQALSSKDSISEGNNFSKVSESSKVSKQQKLRVKDTNLSQSAINYSTSCTSTSHQFNFKQNRSSQSRNSQAESTLSKIPFIQQ